MTSLESFVRSVEKQHIQTAIALLPQSTDLAKLQTLKSETSLDGVVGFLWLATLPECESLRS